MDGSEEVHSGSEDNQEDTTTWSQSQHLWKKTFVQSAETFLLVDSQQRWESPVIFSNLTWLENGVLDSRLDNVEWSVE